MRLTCVTMMDTASIARDGVLLSSASSAQTYPVERTVRLGAAHDDSQQIGFLFSTPQRQLPREEIPPLSAEMIEEIAEIKADDVKEEERLPANWLDAMSSSEEDGSPVIERPSGFLADDNGLYRMFLPDTV
ncbi:hypothetical protein RvVAR031_04840 [Agrobacterium vitis]|nr:hypothetical protein RvVAR031_04840 [Agrobacterium vitis]